MNFEFALGGMALSYYGLPNFAVCLGFRLSASAEARCGHEICENWRRHITRMVVLSLHASRLLFKQKSKPELKLRWMDDGGIQPERPADERQ